ncbi:E6 protein [Felis domesticus papillomavirus 1]|uniref:Protein E6 n=2 Tax=Lambdapapillomavirus 1 TaxID=181667 RepID=Q77DW1_9PAPI|nr:E6 protein [Felis domesticus papillomavirus 1]AAL86453.1 E6 protein [Felis domesticus papillomavirus 1]AAM33460.1 putative transforming protein E6 [Lambdapapillomavirus 1]UUK30320.1 E6 [Felis domesticus papillomavirus 1]
MARPSSVQGLCAATGAAFADLLLPCSFCLRFLTSVEKSLFDAYPLQLQWKQGCAFGCCQSCIRKCALVERACYFQRKVTDSEVAGLLERVREACVRCGYCMRALGPPDKIQCCLERDLDLIRGKVRGRCGLCRLSVEG